MIRAIFIDSDCFITTLVAEYFVAYNNIAEATLKWQNHITTLSRSLVNSTEKTAPIVFTTQSYDKIEQKKK